MNFETESAMSSVDSDGNQTLAAGDSETSKTSTDGKVKKTPIKSQSLDDAQQQRRSSSRSIKRKKFDDELVESSITHPKPQRSRTLSSSVTPSLSGKGLTPSVSSSPVATTSQTFSAGSSNVSSAMTSSSSSSSTSTSAMAVEPVAKSASVSVPPEVVQPVASVAKKSKPISTATSASKRRRHRAAHNSAIKDMGRWKPQDDLALVIGVQQTNDLEAVYMGIKFSCKFTLREIEDRWYALLYDPTIAKISVAAMRQLHPDVVSQTHAKALYNKDEEELIKKVQANSQPSMETFEELLSNNTDVFLPYRTAKHLLYHWTQMKHYHLLADQTIQPLPRHEEVINFSDAEETVEKEVTTERTGRDSASSLSGGVKQEDMLYQEIVLADRKTKREIRQLENEIPKWQVLVDSITGVAPSDFDNQTLAVLRGRLVRYLMRSREITLGRCTKLSIVDVDLSLEGPAAKISRKQGLIKLLTNGDFMISNTGKRPFYVDAKAILGNGNVAKLSNNSVVEIAGLRFVFLINQDLIASVRAEALKNQM